MKQGLRVEAEANCCQSTKEIALQTEKDRLQGGVFTKPLKKVIVNCGVVDRSHGAGVSICTEGEIAQQVLGIVNTPMG